MKKPYQSVPLVPSEEPLAPIPKDLFSIIEPHPYLKLGADYDGRSPYFLRELVLRRLIAAQICLQEERPELTLQIFDAYRPIAVQQFMVDYTFAELKGDRLLNESEEKEVWEQVYKFWAAPSDNPATPPPHSTGAAVDLTLATTESSGSLNMGGDIDEIGDRSYPDFYSEKTDAESQQYHQNRCLLRQVMTKAGFVQHPNEWWHFSYGDQMWAWQKKEAIAHYGRI
ncbi:peptidase M15D vanX D-ala-D-ala dipeptidase [[Leptolyngbya] sp. PCC 7376]|uniref:M15 family metallopeptidase n=1 Tax=[Leptolyngbya] sp. PCC 7376 TaxID=111781 RepID=UPI00029EEBDA|nr:M15 family metallopeptidase [[Leptolyngbya] sp. PCC 7376]AFY39838.1 peptidase M15D vanX D-ala-D-ala dipeptidase [[Leptolyngbya] sp. PCC 7376]